MKFFLDTYALIEFVRGNKAYEKYLREELFTSLFNLYELYYNLIKVYPEERAREFYLRFSDFLVPLRDSYIFRAARFKLQHIKREISYTDALGYVIAELEQMRFLTGDKEFRAMDNVEFVR